jgi:hypothetical protein
MLDWRQQKFHEYTLRLRGLWVLTRRAVGERSAVCDALAGNANQCCQNPGAGVCEGERVLGPPGIVELASRPAARASARRTKEGRISEVGLGDERVRNWLRTQTGSYYDGLGNKARKTQRDGYPPRRLCMVSSLHESLRPTGSEIAKVFSQFPHNIFNDGGSV